MKKKYIYKKYIRNIYEYIYIYIKYKYIYIYIQMCPMGPVRIEPLNPQCRFEPLSTLVSASNQVINFSSSIKTMNMAD